MSLDEMIDTLVNKGNILEMINEKANKIERETEERKIQESHIKNLETLYTKRERKTLDKMNI